MINFIELDHIQMLFLIETNLSKWFEPKSISSSYCVIVRVRVVLKRTVVGDWRFDNLSGSHLQSQVNSDKRTSNGPSYIWLTMDGSKPTNDWWQNLPASLSANTIMAKLTNHVQRTRLITPSTDKHYSLDSEDDFRSGCRNVSHQQQFFSELLSPGRSHNTNYWNKSTVTKSVVSKVTVELRRRVMGVVTGNCISASILTLFNFHFENFTKLIFLW